MKRYFPELEGLRTILSACIVFVHTNIAILFKSNVLDNLKFNPIVTMTLAGGAIHVDYFFVISGFLTTLPIMNTSENTPLSHIPVMILKKFVRMWPAVFVAIALSIAVNDPYTYPLSTLIRRALLFEVYSCDQPQALGPMWSNRVDIIASVLIALTCVCGKQYLLNKMYGLYIAKAIIVLSYLPAAYVILSSNLKSIPDPLGLFMIPKLCEWINVRYSVNIQHNCALDESVSVFGAVVYLPWYTRMSSCFLGFSLAVAVTHYRKYILPLNTANGVSKNANYYPGAYKPKVLYVCLSLFGMLVPHFFGFLAARKKRPPPPEIAKYILFTAFSLSRFLAATGFSYVLYYILLPSEDTHSFVMLKRLLTNSFFKFVGPLTYSIYMTHFAVVFEIMFWVPTQAVLSIFQPLLSTVDLTRVHVGRDFVLMQTYFAMIYSASLLLGAVVEMWVERPIVRGINNLIGKWMKPSSELKMHAE